MIYIDMVNNEYQLSFQGAGVFEDLRRLNS